MTNFNSKQDLELIVRGSHFWCLGCLSVRPLDAQSSDSRYCQACYGLVKSDRDLDKAQMVKADCWTDDGMIFVTGGQRYGVSPAGGTVCMGPGPVTPRDAILTPLAGSRQWVEAVTKIPQEESIRQYNPAIQTAGIMLQEKRGRGRPQKPDGEPICRMTAWRRRKEERQVVLI